MVHEMVEYNHDFALKALTFCSKIDIYRYGPVIQNYRPVITGLKNAGKTVKPVTVITGVDTLM